MAKRAAGVSHRGYSTDKVVVPKSLPSGPAPGAKKAAATNAATKKTK